MKTLVNPDHDNLDSFSQSPWIGIKEIYNHQIVPVKYDLKAPQDKGIEI